MRYEMIREIFNECSNNQMRDVFVEDVETDNPRQWLDRFLAGKEVHIEETVCADGTLVFDVMIANLKQRFSFSPEN